MFPFIQSSLYIFLSLKHKLTDIKFHACTHTYTHNNNICAIYFLNHQFFHEIHKVFIQVILHLTIKTKLWMQNMRVIISLLCIMSIFNIIFTRQHQLGLALTFPHLTVTRQSDHTDSAATYTRLLYVNRIHCAVLY